MGAERRRAKRRGAVGGRASPPPAPRGGDEALHRRAHGHANALLLRMPSCCLLVSDGNIHRRLTAHAPPQRRLPTTMTERHKSTIATWHPVNDSQHHRHLAFASLRRPRCGRFVTRARHSVTTGLSPIALSAASASSSSRDWKTFFFCFLSHIRLALIYSTSWCESIDALMPNPSMASL